MFFKLVLGTVVFSIALMKGVWLDRSIAAALSATNGPHTLLDNNAVSIGLFATSIVAVATFLLWVSRDRLHVEKRLDAGEAAQRSADERHMNLAEAVKDMAESQKRSTAVSEQRHNELLQALKGMATK